MQQIYNGQRVNRAMMTAAIDTYRDIQYPTFTAALGNRVKYPRKRKLFCELNPVCYQISLYKERLKRHIHDSASTDCLAGEISTDILPNLVFAYRTNMIKADPHTDLRLQYNKADNIRIAAKTMNGMLIYPREVFSFWKPIGRLTRKKGYKDGRVIIGDQLVSGIGGGLCNLAHAIHILVLHSPLEVTEFHSHSDALSPDNSERVPFSAGTSVSCNQIDFRFKNTTNQVFQLLTRCENNTLAVELRSERSFRWYYSITEENHHFCREGDKFYRISRIYRNTTDKITGQCIEKKLILDNHSEVMFDYTLIPRQQIS